MQKLQLGVFLPLLYLNVRIAKKKMNMIIQNSVIYVDTRQIGIMKYQNVKNAERSLKYKVKNGVENMNVLEKILEEIDRLDDPYFVGYIDRYKVKEIIRSHMDDQNGDVTEKPSAAELIRAQGAAVKDGIRIGILEKNEGQ